MFSNLVYITGPRRSSSRVKGVIRQLEKITLEINEYYKVLTANRDNQVAREHKVGNPYTTLFVVKINFESPSVIG